MNWEQTTHLQPHHQVVLSPLCSSDKQRERKLLNWELTRAFIAGLLSTQPCWTQNIQQSATARLEGSPYMRRTALSTNWAGVPSWKLEILLHLQGKPQGLDKLLLFQESKLHDTYTKWKKKKRPVFSHSFHAVISALMHFNTFKITQSVTSEKKKLL